MNEAESRRLGLPRGVQGSPEGAGAAEFGRRKLRRRARGFEVNSARTAALDAQADALSLSLA